MIRKTQRSLKDLVGELNTVTGLSGDDRYCLLGTYFFALFRNEWSKTGLTKKEARTLIISLIQKETN
tara:strand:- start:3830 stop:4030 length:201 start_codon:yes stop_codon:yes gene_type:complete